MCKFACTRPNAFGCCATDLRLIRYSYFGTQIVFTFGSGYNSYDHWYLSSGDSYVLHVMGRQFSGTVSFT